jgi:hypothetical protein
MIIGRSIWREKLDQGAMRRTLRRRFGFLQHPNGRTKAQQAVTAVSMSWSCSIEALAGGKTPRLDGFLETPAVCE